MLGYSVCRLAWELTRMWCSYRRDAAFGEAGQEQQWGGASGRGRGRGSGEVSVAVSTAVAAALAALQAAGVCARCGTVGSKPTPSQTGRGVSSPASSGKVLWIIARRWATPGSQGRGRGSCGAGGGADQEVHRGPAVRPSPHEPHPSCPWPSR